MITIKAEREYYCLATDGEAWRVIERRAGKYYPLGNCTGPGVTLDEPGAATLFGRGRHHSEAAARRELEDIGTEWRELLGHIR
jgi:hypothetical protein